MTILLCLSSMARAGDYAGVDAIFSKYCLDCHDGSDPDGKLVLSSFDDLMKGGESGAVVVPGDSSKSLIVQMVQGTAKRNGRRAIMPPKKRKKLDPSEIIALKAWIDSGAHGPSGQRAVIAELTVPRIVPHGAPRDPVNTLIVLPHTNLFAVARYGKVELRSVETGALVRTLSGHRGAVNALAVSPDGCHLYSAAGEPVRFGEIKSWNLAHGKLERTWTGHKDAIYSLAISPDGKILASGSYDQKVELWDAATGKLLRTLSGHNGGVFGLAFRPDGKILASASADHTVKLWDVATGERRDTLSQPTKEVFAVAFSPDGRRLTAAGGDNRIRIWSIGQTAAEGSNPLLDSKFAHDGAILRLAFSADGKLLISSADDRTIRVWDMPGLTERLLLEKQPDWATGIGFLAGAKKFVTGRMDGSLAIYDLTGHGETLGKLAAATPPPKPELARIEPHGMQRGTTVKMKFVGDRLEGLTSIKFSNPQISARIEKHSATEAWADVTVPASLPRAAYEVWVANAQGESQKIKLYVGHLPHVYKSQKHDSVPLRLPVSYWGQFEPGVAEQIPFTAQAGQTIVFDLASRAVGSKAHAVLSLVDTNGTLLATKNPFLDNDPLLAYTFTNNGVYRLRVVEETAEGSPDYYYRVTMGELPMVVAVFPPALGTNSEADVRLLGYNLAGKDTVRVHPTKAGELEIPLDSDTYRFRHAFKVLVTDAPEQVEREPNDTPANATPITVPGSICGRIDRQGGARNDIDLFRFKAGAGEQWMIEVEAARRGSALDSKVEVLDRNGNPVERAQLQAVRNSAITFRGINSATGDVRVENWPEMDLDQYLYMQGEVCKIFRMPQGPDSGLVLYKSNDRRQNYFDTTATIHELDEPCYIVQPHPPGEKLVPNGLPVFPVYYVNDDDPYRFWKTDSRLHFTAPAAADYLIRVTDSRGQGGPDYTYRLIVRRPHPDFNVTLSGAELYPKTGGGREFTLTANREDEFDGAIRVDITNAPPGWQISTPIVIQAGQAQGFGAVNCDSNAVVPGAAALAKIKLTARAWLNGKEVTKPVNGFTRLSPAPAGKLLVACEPYDERATNFTLRSTTEKPLELTISPGATVPLWIKIQRRGFDDLVTFTADNLPHGVIVDNIGLNGVLIPAGETRREIFLRAAGWVPDTDCLFFVRAAQEDGPTSFPLLLHVRRHEALAQQKWYMSK